MNYTTEELGEILTKVDLSGFTVSLKGELKRYIVWLTNNTERSLEQLVSQANFFASMYDSITIGWRTDPQSNEVFIDIGTSLDDLKKALLLWKKYNQQCVRDSKNELEIWRLP